MIYYAPWENLFKHADIDLILDVGANSGQTYESFRWAGFKGPICSFEPNPEMFKQLAKQPGEQWQRLPYALSSLTGQAEFFITDNDNSNGLQAPLLEKLKVKSKINVQTYRLDELWSRENFSARNVFLKIDTEGHDMEVVKGASGILDRIHLIMMETSPLPRYQGEPPFSVVVNNMNDMGFLICRVEKIISSPGVGMDTALDVVFARRDLVAKAIF